MTNKQTSDGGSTSYYELPPGATELNDLIEHKNMPFWRGNIFKASYRLGEKDCAEEEYDLRKIIYFAERRLKQIEKEKDRPRHVIIPAMYGGLVEDGSDAF